MGWNGLDLQTEFSTALGDTSDGFKSKTLGFINDIQDDICSKFHWGFLRKNGRKLLSTLSEYQDLTYSAPTAPTVAAQVGGTLTSGSIYYVRVTFMDSNNYETEGGTESVSVSVSGTTLQIGLTAIPISPESLVNKRRVYLKKDSGAYYLYSTISDNTTTVLSITADTTSTVQPPDYKQMQMVIADPWTENNSRQLIFKTEAQLRLAFPGSIPSGDIEFYDSTDFTRVMTYPKPNTAIDLFFNYIRVPARIVAEVTSQPEIPQWMKLGLDYGVKWKGYEYRERDLSISYGDRYEAWVEKTISERGGSRVGPGRVRDVMGNTDGWAY